MKFTEELKQRIINHFNDISAEELYITLVDKYKFPIYDFYSENYVKYKFDNKNGTETNIFINNLYDTQLDVSKSSFKDLSTVASRNVTPESIGSSSYDSNEINNAFAA